MKNVYDIRREKKLFYIFSDIAPDSSPDGETGANGRGIGVIYAKTAVILYLYYIDTLPVYWPYMERIPKGIDLYILSSRAEVLEEARAHMALVGRGKVFYIQKENCGRDISALLVVGAEIVTRYRYVCFLHDKKEHSPELKKDTDLWIRNLWGNLIGGADYIRQILELFERTESLGVLAPPDPIGDHFCIWYGYGWHQSFSVTERLARELGLKADLSIDKPPITLGTALWFKSEALWKLFERGWRYTDFDDSQLSDPAYISYGIERIFAYVAQDAGYDTGTVTTTSYAEMQMGYLQYSTGRLFAEARSFFPVTCLDDLQRYKRSQEKVVEFAQENRKLYLYGAGEMGRFCFYLLRAENLSAMGYLVSEESREHWLNGLPVSSVQEVGDLSEAAVIITVYDKAVQDVIADRLKERGCHRYIRLWE